MGGERLEVRLEDSSQCEAAAAALAAIADGSPFSRTATLRVPLRPRTGAIAEAVRRLDGEGIGIDDIALRSPTLDDVFLTLTGPRGGGAPDEDGAAGERERAGMSPVAATVSDTLVIAKRSLLRIPRQPDLLVGFTIQPVMFVLLFVYVLGGAIQTPGYDYVDFLIPGIIVQSMVFGGFVTALGLAEDLKKGLIDRFRSLPMASSALLTGRTLADIATNVTQLAIMIGVGLVGGLQTSRRAFRRSWPGSRSAC